MLEVVFSTFAEFAMVGLLVVLRVERGVVEHLGGQNNNLYFRLFSHW